MPLLMCPNDNSSMQTVHRAGVEFEMCPACRGVWLDRGELEKMMEAAKFDRPIDPPSHSQAHPQVQPQPHYEEPRRYEGDRHRDPRWEDDDYRRRKRRGMDIFDIFD